MSLGSRARAVVRPTLTLRRKRRLRRDRARGVHEHDRADGSPPRSSASSRPARSSSSPRTHRPPRRRRPPVRLSGLNGTLIYAAQDPQGWVLCDVGSADGSGRARAPGRPADQPGRRLEREPRLGRPDEPRASAGRQHPALPHAGEPSDPDRCRRPRHVVIRRPGHHLAPGRGPDAWLPPARRDRQPCGVVRHLRCPVRRDDVRAPDHDRAERHVHLRGGRARIDRVDRLRRWRLHGAIHRRPHAAESVRREGISS